MPIKNLTAEGRNSQKVTESFTCVKVDGVSTLDTTDREGLMATLPADILVSEVRVINHLGTTASFQVNLNGAVALSSRTVPANGIVFQSARRYLATGGDVVIKATSGQAEAFEVTVIIVYVELGKRSGEYTAVKDERMVT